MADLILIVLAVISFPMTIGLLYVWIFSGPSIFDELPEPDKKREDLLKEM